MLLLEDVQREPHRLERDDSETLTESTVDAELARMATMTAEEAAYAAACAVAEAEALMAEAEAAAREAEAAEADAQAAQAFAEASLMTIKNRNVMELVIILVFELSSYMFNCASFQMLDYVFCNSSVNDWLKNEIDFFGGKIIDLRFEDYDF
jgi:myb proto-oncogene protein